MAGEKNITGLTLVAILIVLIIYSCDKFDGDQTIPAYIQIDSFNLVRNSANEIEVEGALTHNITDVWVYVNDQVLGAYELPAIIPVLVEGKNKLVLSPGIKKNGISNTRDQYSFYMRFEDFKFDFFIDSIITFMPVIKYDTINENIWFAWTENFENGASSLKKTNRSDTSLQIIYHEPAHPDFGSFTAEGYLSGDHTLLECATGKEEPEDIGDFWLPPGGAPVFLEMDYNINSLLVIGLIVHDYGNQITTHPVLILNPTDGIWKKVYVNFSPTVLNFPNAEYFNVFIRADKQTTTESPVYKLDNFKLIYRKR